MSRKKLFRELRTNRWLISWVITFIFCLNAAVAFAANERVMPLGDSITQGNQYHNSYRRALWFKMQDAGYTVDFVGSLDTNYQAPSPNQDFDRDHEGHWGWRTDQLLDDLPGWLQGYTPDIVLLHAGTNDVFQQVPLQDVVDNIKSIIDTLRSANPQVTILLARLIPIKSNRGNARISALNTRLPGIVAEKNNAQSPVILVDQNSGFSASADTYDGVHPNAQGEKKMAQKWFDALRGVLSEPDDVTPDPISDDQCDFTYECRQEYGNRATDCKNSRSDNSICMCGNQPCADDNTPVEPDPVDPSGDQCDFTYECRQQYGNSATDCKNSRSDNSICMCGSQPCVD